MEDNVICHCGGDDSPHDCGSSKCYRYVIEIDEEPSNRRRIYNPEWFDEPVVIWDVGDHWVTDYTLHHQRMYARCEVTGRWTRPKRHKSVNSIKA